MKAFWVLYIKELKSNKLIVLYLITLNFVFLYFYESIAFQYPHTIMKIFQRNFVLLTALFVFPLMLFYLFSLERRINTNLLLFSMPVGRATFLIVKFFAVISFAFILPTIPIAFEIVRSFKLIFSDSTFDFMFGFARLRLVLNHLIIYYIYILPSAISPVILLAGLMVFIKSFHSFVKRCRVLHGLIFLIISLVLICWIYNFFNHLSSPGFTHLPFNYQGYVANIYPVYVIYIQENLFTYFAHDCLRSNTKIVYYSMYLYLPAAGLLFMSLGLVLYTKYSDV